MIRGMRKKENEKFERYFTELVIPAAAELGCVFFGDAGDGHEYIDDKYDAEDLMGWLIPEEMADEFEPIYLDWHNQDDEVRSYWDDYFLFADWKFDEEGNIKVFFDDYNGQWIYEEMLRNGEFDEMEKRAAESARKARENAENE